MKYFPSINKVKGDTAYKFQSLMKTKLTRLQLPCFFILFHHFIVIHIRREHQYTFYRMKNRSLCMFLLCVVYICSFILQGNNAAFLFQVYLAEL